MGLKLISFEEEFNSPQLQELLFYFFCTASLLIYSYLQIFSKMFIFQDLFRLFLGSTFSSRENITNRARVSVGHCIMRLMTQI